MKLSQQMILTRAKQSCLSLIKELNLCGHNLTDVSAVSNLMYVEVLALSVNNISSLAPFSGCKSLKELYLRRNNITDVTQLFHLRSLPFLQNVWLNENPFCTELGSNYRAIVVSILPNLRVLDNIPVTPDDIEKSKYFNAARDEASSQRFDDNNKEDPTNSVCMYRDNGENLPNVLSAIISLVKELDLDGLEFLQDKICHRINAIYVEKH